MNHGECQHLQEMNGTESTQLLRRWFGFFPNQCQLNENQEKPEGFRDAERDHV